MTQAHLAEVEIELYARLGDSDVPLALSRQASVRGGEELLRAGHPLVDAIVDQFLPQVEAKISQSLTQRDDFIRQGSDWFVMALPIHLQ